MLAPAAGAVVEDWVVVRRCWNHPGWFTPPLKVRLAGVCACACAHVRCVLATAHVLCLSLIFLCCRFARVGRPALRAPRPCNNSSASKLLCAVSWFTAGLRPGTIYVFTVAALTRDDAVRAASHADGSGEFTSSPTVPIKTMGSTTPSAPVHAPQVCLLARHLALIGLVMPLHADFFAVCAGI